MQKSISIIITIAAVFSLLIDCGGKSDLAIRFEMEEMFSQADKLRNQLTVKNQKLSEQDLQTLIDAYTAIERKIDKPKDSTETANASQEKTEAWHLAFIASIKVGLLYLDAKNYEKAFDNFKSAEENLAASKAEKNNLLRYMGISMEKQKNYSEAAKYYNLYAIGYKDLINPDNPDLKAFEAPIKIANMWFMANDTDKFRQQLEKAKTYYNDLIALYPNTPTEHLALGKVVYCYIKQENYSKAISLLKSKKNKETGLLDPNILLMITDLYMKNIKDFKKAENTYREFLSLYPEHKKSGAVHLGLGLSLYEQRKYAKARKAVKDIEIIPSVKSQHVADAYYLTGLCYEKENRWEKALNQFDLIRATFPGSIKSFEAYLYIADYYQSKGQKKLAAKAFTEAEEYIKNFSNPQTSSSRLASQSLYYQAVCYKKQKKYSKACEILTELYSSYPNQHYSKLVPLELADIYEFQQGDTAKALQWLNIHIENNPDAKDILKAAVRIKALE